MEDILSIIVIAICIILSISPKYRRYYKRYMKRQKPTQRQVIRHPQDANVDYTEQRRPNDNYGEPDNGTFRYPSLSQEADPIAVAPSDANETAENSENPQDFDLRAAIIYSEILKPKFDEK